MKEPLKDVMRLQSDGIHLKTIITTLSLHALSRIRNPRFYETERGFQGEFTAELHEIMREQGFLDQKFVLEDEYQKRWGIHLTTQRPDIIFHLPREVSGAEANENNVAVWALKLIADPDNARGDFNDLDQMFSHLHYSVGVFINISSQSHYLHLYAGPFPERMVAFATSLKEGAVSVTQAVFSEGTIIEKQYKFNSLINLGQRGS